MKKLLIVFLAFLAFTLLLGYSTDNIFKNGENVIIEKGTVVNNIICFNGDVTLDGQVSENLVVINGNVFLNRNSSINGDILVIGGEVKRSRNAKVLGGITTISNNEINNIVNSILLYKPKELSLLQHLPSVFNLSILFIILLTVILFPKIIGDISFATETKPWKSLLTGLTGYLLILPISLLLLFSFVGIMLIPFYFILLFLLYFLGSIAITQLIGKRVALLLKIKNLPILWETLIGLILITLLKNIYIFGTVLTLTINIFALGAGIVYILSVSKKNKPLMTQ
jgi:hypothetical protein